jgi:hypothetical protein
MGGRIRVEGGILYSPGQFGRTIRARQPIVGRSLLSGSTSKEEPHRNDEQNGPPSPHTDIHEKKSLHWVIPGSLEQIKAGFRNPMGDLATRTVQMAQQVKSGESEQSRRTGQEL